MNRLVCWLTVFSVAVGTPGLSFADEPNRQEVVRQRSADVMPFDMMATAHIFTKDSTGGVQRVVARRGDDAQQIQMVRAHLKEISEKFRQGDFTSPTHVHGTSMPGLAALKAAPPGDLQSTYREIPAGAEIVYFSRNPSVVTAVHQWFDAQLSDHGADAMAGHDHSMPHNPG